MNFKTALITASLAGAAGFGHADTVPLTPIGPGLLAGTFTQAAEGVFVHDFSFMPETFNGLVSVTLQATAGPLGFLTATLNGQSFSTDADQVPEFSFSAFVSADMPLSLTVFGVVLDADGNPSGTGSYRGTLLAAVPEPQTWALLLAGIGVLAWAARERRLSRA